MEIFFVALFYLWKIALGICVMRLHTAIVSSLTWCCLYAEGSKLFYIAFGAVAVCATKSIIIYFMALLKESICVDCGGHPEHFTDCLVRSYLTAHGLLVL